MLTDYDGHRVPVWVARRLEYARHHGWNGTVISGWRSEADQVRAAQEYAARVGQPLHVLYPRGVLTSRHLGKRWPGGAVDVTDPNGLELAMERWTVDGHFRPLRGNGYALASDRSHFSRDGR